MSIKQLIYGLLDVYSPSQRVGLLSDRTRALSSTPHIENKPSLFHYRSGLHQMQSS